MPIVKLDPFASEAIKIVLLNKGLPLCVRIVTRSTECCDSTIGLAAGGPEDVDFIEELNGLRISMSPKTYKLAGDVSISCFDDAEIKSFLLVSEKVLNKWAEFATICPFNPI